MYIHLADLILYTVYEIKTIIMHLFMITSWNKIGINIGDLFLFLAFDPEDEKWHPTPPEDAIFARGNKNI